MLEHVARLANVENYRREENKFGEGIHLITDSSGTAAAIRFDASEFTPEAANIWLEEHDYQVVVEPAEEIEETGVMVALKLPDEVVGLLGVEGGLHLTLAYLGTIDEQPTAATALSDAVARFALGESPYEATLNGGGYFEAGESGLYPVYANFDAPELPAFRQRLVDALQISGFEVSADHGFSPHVTLSYVVDPSELPVFEPVGYTVDSIALYWGGIIIPFELKGERMPYDIRQRGSKWCLFREGNPKPLGCHSTLKDAERQKRAVLAATHVREGCISCEPVSKPGNIENLAQHLANKYGGDPGFFTKCVGADELAGYDEERRKAICARAHNIVVGIWPGEHKRKFDSQPRDPRGRFSSIPGATINERGTDVRWRNEDTVEGTVVIETPDDVDTSTVSDEQIVKFIRQELPGKIRNIGSSEDIESVTVKDVARGKGYLSVSVDITPTVEAGTAWLDDVAGEEEWALYHEESKRDRSYGQEETIVRDAWRDTFEPLSYPEPASYVKAVFPDKVLVESNNGDLHFYPYFESEGGIVFGEPYQVEVEYRPVTRSTVAVALLKALTSKNKLAVWKDDGQRWYAAIVSAAFKDDEQEVVTSEGMDYSIGLGRRYGCKSKLYLHHLVPQSKIGECVYETRIGPFWLEIGRFTKGHWLADRVFEILKEDKRGRWKVSIGFLTPVAQKAAGVYTTLFKYDSSLTDRPANPWTAIAIGGKAMEGIDQIMRLLAPVNDAEKEKYDALLREMFTEGAKELSAVSKSLTDIVTWLQDARDGLSVEEQATLDKALAVLEGAEESSPSAEKPQADLDELLKRIEALEAAGKQSGTLSAKRLEVLEKQVGTLVAMFRRLPQELGRPTADAPALDPLDVEKVLSSLSSGNAPQHPLAGMAGAPKGRKT